MQEISPGGVATEIAVVGGLIQPGTEMPAHFADFPMLKDADVSQAVGFLLTTPYSVNLSEIVIKPTGEKY